jgi:hypothetical protein
MEEEGMGWYCKRAKVQDCGVFQSEDGEPMAYAKVAMFGGLFSLTVTPDDMRKLEPHKGKFVSISGSQTYEIKKKSGNEVIKFYLGEITPLK